MRSGAKIAPNCSLQTALSIRGDLRGESAWAEPKSTAPCSHKTDYKSLPSPSQNSTTKHQRQYGRRRCAWLYNYPRVSFTLIYLACTYASGLYVSSKMTQWMLRTLKVPEALAQAREQYHSTSAQLEKLNACVLEASMRNLVDVQVQAELQRHQLQERINANYHALDAFENATLACAERTLDTIDRQAAADNSQFSSTSSANTSTFQCFVDGFNKSFRAINASSPNSRSLLLRVHRILITNTLAGDEHYLHGNGGELDAELNQIWQPIAADIPFIGNQMNTTKQAMTLELDTLQQFTWLDQLIDDDKSNPVQGIKPLVTVVRKVLRFLAGIHVSFAQLAHAIDQEWTALETRIDNLVERQSDLRRELLLVVNSTQHQANRTKIQLHDALDSVERSITFTLNTFALQWKPQVRALIEQRERPWYQLVELLKGEYESTQRRLEQKVVEQHFLPVHALKEDLSQEQVRLQRRQNHQHQNNSQMPTDDVTIDKIVFNKALVDMGHGFAFIVMWGDIIQSSLRMLDMTMALITESYSTMPMVDIRDVSSIQTWKDWCDIFRCKHSLSSIWFTLVTTDFLAVHNVLQFLFVMMIVIAGTTLLFLWKQEHLSSCAEQRSGYDKLQEESWFRWTLNFFTNGVTNSTIDPVGEMEHHITFVDEYIASESSDIQNDAMSTWDKQSHTLLQLQDYHKISAIVSRIYHECAMANATAKIENENTYDQCMNTTEIVPPVQFAWNLTTETSAIFNSCFDGDQPGQDIRVQKLEFDQSCASEKTIYLTLTSWWLLFVVFLVNHFIARMMIRAVGLYWWRFLSADRLHFVGFCYEDGTVQAASTLSAAIKRHLSELKTQISWKMFGVCCALMCEIIIAIITIQSIH